MEEYDLLLTEYEIKLFQSGLDENDCWKICNYIKKISLEKNRKECQLQKVMESCGPWLLSFDKIQLEEEIIQLKQYIFYLDDLLTRYNNLKRIIRKSILKKEKDFILEEACLTHLVYTNNEFNWIKLYSDNSFMFLCQFHNEKTPSMGVTNYKGLFNCYGCGSCGNAIDYISAYENLTLRETVELLARIYMIDLPNNSIDEYDSTVTRYRKSLISDEFYDLLKRGYNRTSKRPKTNEIMLAIEKFEKDFETIERIKKRKHLNYIKENDKRKKLVLKIPEFN